MSNDTYNDWSNYATWRINLELADDIAENTDDGRFDSEEELAEFFAEEVDQVLMSFTPEGLTLDYARAFVSDVNWDEIAAAHAELVSSEDDEE